MKKIIIISVSVLLVVLVAISTIGWHIFGSNITSANSVEKLRDGLYTLEFKGDYSFDEFLSEGGAATDEELGTYIQKFLSKGFFNDNTQVNENKYGCSAMTVKNSSDEQLMGRNFDWSSCDAMIVHTIPDDGYESYSTSCINLLNFGSSYKPEGFANQYKALACIYVPLDGINEKGLCVADLINGDSIETHQNTEKPDLTIPTAVRLLLDKAGTVDEAISLLENYDLNSSVNTSHHFSISDASGKSVVVEYIDNEIVVTETDIVTNHYLSQGEKFGVGEDNSKYRFEVLKQTKEVYNNVMNEEQLKTSMQSVSYSGYTQWSIVYNQSDLSFDFYFKGDFNTPYHFGIK